MNARVFLVWPSKSEALGRNYGAVIGSTPLDPGKEPATPWWWSLLWKQILCYCAVCTWLLVVFLFSLQLLAWLSPTTCPRSCCLSCSSCRCHKLYKEATWGRGTWEARCECFCCSSWNCLFFLLLNKVHLDCIKLLTYTFCNGNRWKFRGTKRQMSW